MVTNKGTGRGGLIHQHCILNAHLNVNICECKRACVVVAHTAVQENYGLSLTCHVRECEDTLVETISEQALLELLQDGHAHTQGKGGVSQQ